MSKEQHVTLNRPAEEAAAAPDSRRRAALRKLGAGLGLTAVGSLMPERWSTPLVEMVVSPAQATVSGSVPP